MSLIVVLYTSEPCWGMSREDERVKREIDVDEVGGMVGIGRTPHRLFTYNRVISK